MLRLQIQLSETKGNTLQTTNIHWRQPTNTERKTQGLN